MLDSLVTHLALQQNAQLSFSSKILHVHRQSMNVCYSTSSPAFGVASSLLFLLSFFSFNFNLGRLSCFIFNLTNSFLTSIQYADETIEESLHFFYNFFLLLAFPFDS